MSGMMGEADAIAAALASVQVPQQSAVNNDSLMEAARDLQAQKAADAAARAEHELTRTAIMSGTDPANSPAAAELDQRLREVQCEMELNAQHMRKTDDDAWWVSVDEYGKLGSRCYIPRQCEWQQPRFLSNPAHIDDKAHQEIQKSTTVLPALSRLKNCVEQEWQQQEAMCIGKAKEDKKYELIELEEKGFLADDAYHETVDKLGEATLLQHQGRCTEVFFRISVCVMVASPVHLSLSDLLSSDLVSVGTDSSYSFTSPRPAGCVRLQLRLPSNLHMRRAVPSSVLLPLHLDLSLTVVHRF